MSKSYKNTKIVNHADLSMTLVTERQKGSGAVTPRCLYFGFGGKLRITIIEYETHARQITTP